MANCQILQQLHSLLLDMNVLPSKQKTDGNLPRKVECTSSAEALSKGMGC